jgi:hypothetical protein
LARHVHVFRRHSGNTTEIDMGAMAGMMGIDAIHLRHDLMIEIARVEMALDELRERQQASRPDVLGALEKRRATLSEALARLAA